MPNQNLQTQPTVEVPVDVIVTYCKRRLIELDGIIQELEKRKDPSKGEGINALLEDALQDARKNREDVQKRLDALQAG